MIRQEAEQLAAYCAELWPFGFRTSAQQDALSEGLEKIPIEFADGRADMAKLARESAEIPTALAVLTRLRRLAPAPATMRAQSGGGYSIYEWQFLVRDIAAGRCASPGPIADQAVEEFKRSGKVPTLAALMFANPKAARPLGGPQSFEDRVKRIREQGLGHAPDKPPPKSQGPDAAEFDALVGTKPKAAAARPATIVSKIREGAVCSSSATKPGESSGDAKP